jgi:hypothetical protein
MALVFLWVYDWREEKKTMNTNETLIMCREKYGEILDRQGKFAAIRPSILAGIMMRESACGTSSFLDRPGPEGRGDLEIVPGHSPIKIYHGHGLFQIDDRWHRDFIASGKWQDPELITAYVCSLLNSNFNMIRKYTANQDSEDFDLTAAMAASFNCGAGGVLGVIGRNEDIDSRTTGKNYSREVFRFAKIYRELKRERSNL